MLGHETLRRIALHQSHSPLYIVQLWCVMTQYQIVKARTQCWCEIVQNYLLLNVFGSALVMTSHCVSSVQCSFTPVTLCLIGWCSHLILSHFDCSESSKYLVWYLYFKWYNRYLGFEDIGIFLNILYWTWVLTQSWFCSNALQWFWIIYGLFVCKADSKGTSLTKWEFNQIKENIKFKTNKSIPFVGLRATCSHTNLHMISHSNQFEQNLNKISVTIWWIYLFSITTPIRKCVLPKLCTGIISPSCNNIETIDGREPSTNFVQRLLM